MAASNPIPNGLYRALGSQSPWMMSNALFARVPAMGGPKEPFREVVVKHGDPEWDFVMAYFNHQKPSNRCIKQIVCVHNPDLTSLFEANLKAMDKEAPKFPPNWPSEEPKGLRAKAFARWKAMVEQFSPIRVKSGARDDVITDARVVPLWHGTRHASDICGTGFSYFGKHHLVKPGSASAGSNVSTDIGYFGSGIYFTGSARYAAMYEGSTLLLAWVALRDPYPVVNDAPIPKKGSDMLKLQGLGAFQNYNGHFIPVASVDPSDPECMVFYPCHLEEPAWDEVVVFQKPQALPRFRIDLEVELPRALASPLPPPPQPSASPALAALPAPRPAIHVTQDLLDCIRQLLLKPAVERDVTLFQFLSDQAKRLDQLYPNADLSLGDQRLYALFQQLLDPLGVVQRVIRDQLIPPPPPSASPWPPPPPPLPPVAPSGADLSDWARFIRNESAPAAAIRPNDEKPSPGAMHKAIFKGDVAEVERLSKFKETLEEGSSCGTPLIYACSQASMQANFERQIDKSVLDAYSEVPPAELKLRLFQIIEILIKAGANTRVRANGNVTILHLVTYLGLVEMVEYMIHNQPDLINVQSTKPDKNKFMDVYGIFEGSTALFLASQNSFSANASLMIRKLLAAGASPHLVAILRDESTGEILDYFAPLKSAALALDIEACKDLIAAKADVNPICLRSGSLYYQGSLLHSLIDDKKREAGVLEVMKLLIPAGTSITVRNAKGETPFQYARKLERKLLAEYLVRFEKPADTDCSVS